MPADGVSTGDYRDERMAVLTLAVVDVLDVVVILECLDEPPDEALSPLGCGVDRHQPKGSLAFGHLDVVIIRMMKIKVSKRRVLVTSDEIKTPRSLGSESGRRGKAPPVCGSSS